MGQNQRRPGFLRWGEGARDANNAGDASVDEATAVTGTPQATEPATANHETPSAAGDTADGPLAAAAAPAASEIDAEANPFLRDLVGAMRGVAESSRETAVAELRETVERRVDSLKASAAERADELRRRSELDLGGIGDWERSELERVRAEAEQRRKSRRELLERELADHQSATDRELDAMRARLSDYERQMDEFFAGLADIDDPAEFVSAAKRVPPPPDLSTPAHETPAAAAPSASAPAEANGSMPADAEADALAHRLAQLDERLAPAPEVPVEPALARPATAKPGAADNLVQPAVAGTATATAAPPAQPAASSSTTEVSTPIVVKGLGSFGAITSFKQALERVEGIRGVTLSLGPTGDFVYRASHASDFDLIGAIRGIEGPNAGIEETDGQVRVTIERPR